MNKTLLISHIADMDGLGCVILSKLIFNNLDVILIEPTILEETINNLIKDDNYKKYSNIFITDLGMHINTGNIINNSPLKDIVLHFDHHESSSEVNIFPWSNVISNIGDFKPSGISLFYDYLLKTYPDNKYINYESTKQLVEGIRSYDTYQFKQTGNMLGYNLTNVLVNVGKENIINSITDRIINGDINNFKLTDEELEICEKVEKELEDYLKWCDDNLFKIKFLDYNVGLSISTKFRSSVGNLLSQKYKDELDFILIADYERESFSVRTVNDVNLGRICKMLGGGGHDKAGGFPMTKDNLKLTSPYFDENKLKELKR